MGTSGDDTTSATLLDDDDSESLTMEGIVGIIILVCVVAILILIAYVACKITNDERKMTKEEKDILELTELQKSFGKNDVSNDMKTLNKIWSDGSSGQLQTPRQEKIQIRNFQSES